MSAMLLSPSEAASKLHDILVLVMMQTTGFSREECEKRMKNSAEERRNRLIQESQAENCP